MGYQLQVTGEWGGSVGGWRPAITGTLNQTDTSDAEASTFATYEAAQVTLDNTCRPMLDSDPEDGDPRDCAPRFRIVEVEAPADVEDMQATGGGFGGAD